MTMTLKSTRLEYRSQDASGYEFKIEAHCIPGYGWTATVTMAVTGLVSAEAAVQSLTSPAGAFLRQVKEWKP